VNGKTIYDGASPKTQSIDAVKALLSWKGRGCDPMPSFIEVGKGEGRTVLVLSNKKDAYYVTTPKACSCPSAAYHPEQSCKHQRKHFPQKAEQVRTLNLADEIRPAGKWPHGLNGPVNLQAVV
jgi:folate-dependent phosphoribosylglycinamide formyltransferase PurN